MASIFELLAARRSMAPSVTALVAAVIVASPVAPAFTADVRLPVAADASLQELVGVYADGFTASWVTRAPGDSTVCYGPVGGPERCVTQGASTRYHVVTITGLRPGTAYTYRLVTGGHQVPTGAASPGTFTTLPLPPGKHLTDVVIMNDIHIGESCSGQLASIFGRSMPACTKLPDGVAPGTYSARMLRGAAAQIRAIHPSLVLVNGDLTGSGSYADMVQAKRLLDALGIPYGVTRGNHDRPGQGGAGEAAHCGASRDCYTAVFRPGSTRAVQPRAYEAGGVRFLLLDDSARSPKGFYGELLDGHQRRWLTDQLAAHPDAPTFILTHHPAGYYSNWITTEVGTPRLVGGTWLHRVVAAYPQVVGVINGHTHRNLIGYDHSTGDVPWIENGAMKGYPAGFMVLRLYQGGYIREFHRAQCADGFCAQWAAATAGEIWGANRYAMLGQLSARAFTHMYACDHRTPRASSIPWRIDGATDQDVGGCGTDEGAPLAQSLPRASTRPVSTQPASTHSVSMPAP